MGFFYDRTETKDKIIVKYYPTFILPILLFILGAIASWWVKDFGTLYALVFPLPFIAMIVIFGVHMKKVSEEVSKATRERRTKTSGSRWSFSNPLTVEIKKETK